MTIEQSLPAVTPEQLQRTMRDLGDRVRAWWKQEGLGYLSEFRFTEGGNLSVDLSCSLYSEVQERMYDEDPMLPESQRQANVLKQFESRGFVIYAEPGSDVAVRDCDASTQALRKLIKDTFPSSVVLSLETRGTREGGFVLQSAQVLIRNLAEVFALPALPEKA